MDPQTEPDGPWDPAIDAILVRARRLTAEEIIGLARGDDPPVRPPLEPGRVLSVAAARAARPATVRALRSAVAESVGAGVPEPGRSVLRRLGFLAEAERVATDAASAILLRDRLGPTQAEVIGRRWRDLT